MKRRANSSSACCGGTVTCITCNPCGIPNNNLSISINGGGASTLVVSGGIWTNGTYTFKCDSGYLSLTDGTNTWSLTAQTCNVFSVTFFDGTDTAVITNSSSIRCADCTTPCVSCLFPIVGTISVQDILGTWTATWQPGGPYWTTPLLDSGTVSPVSGCPGGSTNLCNTSTFSGQTYYSYRIDCVSLNVMRFSRAWFELPCTSPPVQYSIDPCVAHASQVGFDSGNITITCGSILWTGTPVGTGHFATPALADPVGGSVTFSGSPFAPPQCCQTFDLFGCSSTPMNGIGTVSVYSSFGGALLSQATENFNSSVIMEWAGSCSVYVTASESNGRLAYAGSLSLTTGNTTSLAMTPVSGFHCYTGTACVWPLPETLHSTFVGITGTQTWTYSAGTWTTSFSWEGVDYVLTISTTGVMTGDSGGTGFVPVFTLNQCPEAFSFTGDIDGNDDPNGWLSGGGTLTE